MVSMRALLRSYTLLDKHDNNNYLRNLIFKARYYKSNVVLFSKMLVERTCLNVMLLFQ